MRQVGLRFLFQSTFFQAVMPEAEVKDVIHKWASGWYRLKDHRFLSGDGWAVDLHAVVGLHVTDLAPPGATPLPSWFGSKIPPGVLSGMPGCMS